MIEGRQPIPRNNISRQKIAQVGIAHANSRSMKLPCILYCSISLGLKSPIMPVV